VSNDSAYIWAGEHFCSVDTRYLYDYEPHRIHNPEIGFPVKLDAKPHPPTFCSRCLQWFDDPEQPTEGLEPQPPTTKETE
jgi:hypothetical protein